MAKRKEFNAGDIVRPHAIIGCTLYPIDEAGQIRFRTHHDNDLWNYTIYLRGFEPIVIEDGVPYNAAGDAPAGKRFLDVYGYVKVNYVGIIYATRINGIVKIGKD